MDKFENRKISCYVNFFKRLIDIIISFIAIILLAPIFLVISLFVRFNLGSPIIFKQVRPGKNEVLFDMYKFRTMTNEIDQQGELLPDEMRLTKFGKLLRNTSLDELPELFNILKGDMSLVGPRPLLVRDMVFMSSEQRQRHSILPGLTGLAQVSGRNAIAWEEKLRLDIEYINNMSWKNDLIIIGKTAEQVIFKKKSSLTPDGINEIELAEDFGDYLLKTNAVTYEEFLQKQDEARELLEVKNGKI